MEVETLKRVNDFALNMYEPLQCNEMVACSAHMDELKPEFVNMHKIEAQKLVESLREERMERIEFTKRQADEIDKIEAERKRADKRAACLGQNLEIEQKARLEREKLVQELKKQIATPEVVEATPCFYANKLPKLMDVYI